MQVYVCSCGVDAAEADAYAVRELQSMMIVVLFLALGWDADRY
jgi:hypothetical protein